MQKHPERGHVEFQSPLALASPEYRRAYDIMSDMAVTRTVAVQFIGRHEIKSLNFETREQAMLFKLRF